MKKDFRLILMVLLAFVLICWIVHVVKISSDLDEFLTTFTELNKLQIEERK